MHIKNKDLLAKYLAVTAVCFLLVSESVNATEVDSANKGSANTESQGPEPLNSGQATHVSQQFKARLAQGLLTKTCRYLEQLVGPQQLIGLVSNIEEANQTLEGIEHLLARLEANERRVATEELAPSDLNRSLVNVSLILRHSTALKQFVDANPDWLSVNNFKNSSLLLDQLRRLHSLMPLDAIENIKEKARLFFK